MEDMINLNDLLKHEILDLYSVEEQIIEALPAMIENANHAELKKALRDHLKVTKEQKNRLDQVKQLMGEDAEQNNGERKGFFSRIFGSAESGGEKCKGMEGIIKEGEKMMEADASDEVRDAAIIASAQKVEHYEICGYGTARTYARELQLNDVANLLEQSLKEEYEADDLLTQLAVSRINLEAEQANGIDEPKSRPAAPKNSAANKNSNGTSSSPGKSRSAQQSAKVPGKKSATEKTKASSNGRSSSSAKNNSSNKSSASKSNRSGGSSKAKSNGQPGKNKNSSKRSSGSSKKSARSKSSASRSR